MCLLRLLFQSLRTEVDKCCSNTTWDKGTKDKNTILVHRITSLQRKKHKWQPTKGSKSALKPKNVHFLPNFVVLQWLPLLWLIIQEGCWLLGTDEDLAVWGNILGGGAGVNERQMRVVPTQLFSQSRSKARRTGRSTGNLRWVLPLFAVARRPAEGWKCLQWGTTSKPFPI